MSSEDLDSDSSRLVHVSIVGFGVRGLSILERIVAAAKELPLRKCIVVDIFDSGENCSYRLNQPDYLLLNIMCGQVSAYPDASSVSHYKPGEGPSLYTWVTDVKRLRIGDDGITVGPTERHEIRPHQFLPRRLFGEYMLWVFDRLIEEAPSNLVVTRRLARVVGIVPQADCQTIQTDAGVSFSTDYVFMTVGQIESLVPSQDEDGRGMSGKDSIRAVYPLPERLAEVAANHTVALAGMGLTAIDVIAALTLGRGGMFRRSEEHSEYVASGTEPKIVMFSRSGLPYRARPRLPSKAPRHQPIFFTTQRIRALLDERPGQVDFEQEILPWLFNEMKLVWLIRSGMLEDVSEVLSKMDDMYDAKQVSYFLGQFAHGVAFDPEDAYFGELPGSCERTFQSSEDYQTAVKEFIGADLAQAWVGADESPTKLALELARDLRDGIRLSVDFGTLSEESRANFFGRHRSLIDRIVVGPQAERNSDLLALMDAGVVSTGLGPSPRVIHQGQGGGWRLMSTMLSHPVEVDADFLIESHAVRIYDDPAVHLFRRLARGDITQPSRISPFAHSVDIDRRFHPINGTGRAETRIWILGLATEGVTYYNNYVMSPSKFVKGFHDADQAVSEMLTNAWEQK